MPTYCHVRLLECVLGPHAQDCMVRRTLKAFGGSLECLYWQVGTDDGYAIGEVADTVTAQALPTAMTRSRRFQQRASARELFSRSRDAGRPCRARSGGGTAGKYARYTYSASVVGSAESWC
jgi:hypothetical protein